MVVFSAFLPLFSIFAVSSRVARVSNELLAPFCTADRTGFSMGEQ